MFKANHKEIKGIAVNKKGNHWELDFDELSKLSNGHKGFMEKVQRCFEQNNDKCWFYNIKVFSWQTTSLISIHEQPWVGIAFRMAGSITYFACCPDGKENSFVVEASYNEAFIAQMAEML